MDTVEHRVWVDHPAGPKEVVLTVTEFSLLQVLLSRPGRAYTREDLTDRAYGDGYHLAERTLDSHVRRIEPSSATKGWIPSKRCTGSATA